MGIIALFLFRIQNNHLYGAYAHIIFREEYSMTNLEFAKKTAKMLRNGWTNEAIATSFNMSIKEFDRRLKEASKENTELMTLRKMAKERRAHENPFERIHIDDERQYDFGYTYGHNSPDTPFELVIYNKKNNGVRAKVRLDKIELLGLVKAIAEHLGDLEAE